MIVKTNYADVRPDVGISVSDGNKDVKSLYKVVVTRENVHEAVETLKDNANVIAFQFEATEINEDLSWLAQEFQLFVGKPIIFVISLKDYAPKDITYELLSAWARLSNPMNVPEPAIRLVFKCPNEHQDIALVYRMSVEFKNTAFCGGYYLNHSFCNLGCIKDQDFPTKVVSKFVPVTTGCVCNCPDVTKDYTTVDYDSVELVYNDSKRAAAGTKVVKERTKAAPSTAPKKPQKPSKPTTSLFSLGGDMLGGF